MAEVSYVTRKPITEAHVWLDQRKPLLPTLDIELTERCNNNCIHCSVNLDASDAAAARRESTAAETISRLGEAAALGCLTVRLTGGEPLLRSDFEEIYVAARRLGLRVKLFTNATLVTPAIASLLRNVPPLDKVEVSIYGLSAASYEAVTRRPGSFEAARRGLDLFVENGIAFAVKGAVLPPTAGEMDEFDAWAGNVCGDAKPPSYVMALDLRSRPDTKKSALIRRLRLEPKEFVRLAARRGPKYARDMREFGARFAALEGDRLFTCLSGKGKGAVDAYGNFQFCLLLRHPDTVYDLRKGSLRTAVTEFLPRVAATRAGNPAYLERCGRCFLRALCLQCPARSWAEHGTLDTPVEYYCDIAHAQAVAIGYLREGEKAWEVRDWRKRVAGPASAEPAPGDARPRRNAGSGKTAGQDRSGLGDE